jgi:hypothetical protein
MEYVQLFIFLKELVRLNVSMNLAIQAVTKLKAFDQSGNTISIAQQLDVLIPKSILKKVSSDIDLQDKVIEQFTGKYLNSEEKMLLNEILRILGQRVQSGGQQSESPKSIKNKVITKKIRN